jgi:hypothetical protein
LLEYGIRRMHDAQLGIIMGCDIGIECFTGEGTTYTQQHGSFDAPRANMPYRKALQFVATRGDVISWAHEAQSALSATRQLLKAGSPSSWRDLRR